MKYAMSLYPILGAILLSTVVFTGCDKSSSKDSLVPDCEKEAAASTWKAIQGTILTKYKCVDCHNDNLTEGGLDLRPEVAHENLVLAKSKTTGYGESYLVFPGDHDLSLLFTKLEAKSVGTTLPQNLGEGMPSGGLSGISADELEAMRLWIRGGAPETGIVEGTPDLLKCGLSHDIDPNKMPPLEPPAVGEGIQFYAGPWVVPPESEDEVCFATHYDFTADGVVPAHAKQPCTENEGGPDRECFAFNYNMLVQDPQSHHSIVRVYSGGSAALHPDWGPWQCLGGALAGTPCDPTRFGEDASIGGAECGSRSICSTIPKSSTACVRFGPSDVRHNRISLSGAQEPVSFRTYTDGVYDQVPIKGLVVWNSHGFNLTSKETTIEQWVNLKFPAEDEMVHRRQRIFERDFIFVMEVPPLEKREYCATHTLPKNGRLMRLSSHVHRRGILFRTWLPPNEKCTPGPDCLPNDTPPVYTSSVYNDPEDVFFDTPLEYNDADEASRTLKFCSVFDNGHDYPELLKRRSQLPANAFCANSEMFCYEGGKHLEWCGGDHSLCDSSPGAGDGNCDACTVRGGVTTEDEMFLLLGSYYVED